MVTTGFLRGDGRIRAGPRSRLAMARAGPDPWRSARRDVRSRTRQQQREAAGEREAIEAEA
ncbi:MAG: hypothetical protein P8R46_10765, partial [Planctomycetota bacterium]|nr:hypothetical protein [Planctomycetota bacterium]